MHNFTRKLILLGALAAFGQTAVAQVLYENFETVRRVSYPFVSGVFTQNQANPASNAVNSSPTVGKYVRAASQPFDVIVINPLAPRLADATPYLNGTKKITMKMYSPAAGRAVQIVVQDKTKSATGYPNGNLGGTFDAVTTVANAWETLTFTYTAGAGGTFDPTVRPTDADQLVMLIEPNTASGATYHFDDLMGPELVAAAPVVDQLYDNFENVRQLNYVRSKTSGGFNSDTVNNAPSAANNSARVGRYTRSTAQFDVLVARPKQRPADVSAYLTNAKQMTMKVFSPAAGIQFQITMQDSTRAGATNYPLGRHSEYIAVTSAVNAWETLVFNNISRPDATISSTSVNELVLLIAPNTFDKRRVYLDDWYGPTLLNTTATTAARLAGAELAPCWPNPATNHTSLSFSLSKPAAVTLAVYDAQGRRVAVPLEQQLRQAGTHTVSLPTAALAAGLYHCRLELNGRAVSQALSIVR
ncbi:Por secretion system C-terminal sorting domain-containing protein [Hymenobacter daecheongensis DSM 21074]|uniref:Por secretion system C-terminal sorting domain-containing protein n=1 Tax=Hymenobacter daecheongensis DSM 21074 TaxID=1121955 RepID=A0A1M6G726_9BACT|nr:T9SS type A sorting domain-containing protein [Hymenobacter daecheongensis]SHJ05723.1 Por secretion system C-terminal sorting domain-containing protein [Hymenobacter daecheongensis DSM 21074]